jgi:hypothetical protein
MVTPGARGNGCSMFRCCHGLMLLCGILRARGTRSVAVESDPAEDPHPAVRPSASSTPAEDAERLEATA